MLSVFKGNEYIKFLVYLKGGECVMFYKLLPNDEDPTDYMNKVTNLLLKAKKEKQIFEIETENFKDSKGKVFEYQSKVVIDGNEISAIKSGMVN
ncbi:hypothetical protein WMO40_12950 [Bacillaceae bacterium CLA-AA-H227]|uniref:Uncharacterized protein n=2 Tax=Robertmurraya TaxID=2837507 RepID=A0A4U1CYS2_9BACI|nr:hypothetical protein [Robertmurraya kyonggiensis]TKC15052.1 hypothetical protein FA727_19345 [Robertmurraya kyonggiensis]